MLLFYVGKFFFILNGSEKNTLSIVFCKEDFKYLKTSHDYHLVDQSPWPVAIAIGALALTTGLVSYMHEFSGGFSLLTVGFLTVFFILYCWWRDVVWEATFEDQHSVIVQKGIKLGMVLFIASEIMFFFSIFWSFFHTSVAPISDIGGVWPPFSITTMDAYTIPLTNTVILLTSGITITWSHHALVARSKTQALISLMLTLILACIFTYLQGLEYISAPFNISDGAFGSTFYMATGFHGAHVIIGTIALFVAFLWIGVNHFTNQHHFGFESSIWYWHMVDTIWLVLFAVLY